MPKITMYTTRWCGYCVRAKALLDSRGLEYEEINLDDDPQFRRTLHELTGGWTVPQIVIGGEPIGGYTELWRLDKSGELDGIAAERTETGVPVDSRRFSRVMSPFRMRMQPREMRPGISPGALVPWMPMKPPPGQSVRTADRAERPKAYGP